MNTSPGHTRLWIALLIGFGAGLCCTLIRPIGPETHVDIGWAINAARDLLAGQDPYRYAPSPVLVPYPLTAAIIVFPWALLPYFTAQTLCFGMISGILAYGLLRDGQYWRLLVFVSPSFLIAMGFMQWSPLFLAVLYYPALAPVLLAKPTLALPVVFSIRWTRWQIAGACIIGLLSLVALPDWPFRWLRQIHTYGGFVPLLSFLGPVFLLSLLFWRNPRARFFLFFADYTAASYALRPTFVVGNPADTNSDDDFDWFSVDHVFVCLHNGWYTLGWSSLSYAACVSAHVLHSAVANA